MPKMPTLGPQPRKSGWVPVLFLLLFAAAAGGYAWKSKHASSLSFMTAERVASTGPAAAPGAPPSVLPAPLTTPAPGAAPAPAAGAPVAPPSAPALPGLAPTSLSAGPAAPAKPSGPRHLAVAINGPLETALVEGAGRDVGPALAQVVTRALVWWVSIPGDLRKGDRLDVIYEERTNEEPVVDAVRLVSGKFNKTFQAYRFKAEGDPFSRFYQPSGEELELRLRTSPVEGYEQITSLIKDGRHHKGVDFKTPAGTKVRATFAGTLTRKNWKWKANGNCLELTESGAPFRHAMFLHLSELPKSLAVGKHVARGEVIAESGNTGHSFAPHLHYQLMGAGDRVLDPFDTPEKYRRSLPASEKPALDTWVNRWTAMMGPPGTPTVASSGT